MAEAGPRTQELFHRWRELSPTDRAAILDVLPRERGHQLEELIAEAETAEAVADRQFAVYSAWLGLLVEEAVSTVPGDRVAHRAIRPAVWQALANVHGAVMPEAAAVGSVQLLLARVRQMFGSWMQRV